MYCMLQFVYAYVLKTKKNNGIIYKIHIYKQTKAPTINAPTQNLAKA